MKRKLSRLAFLFLTVMASQAFAVEYGTMTDNRDGHIYRTVQIGKQVWTAENMALNLNGSYPPKGDTNNIKKYGRLYSWNLAQSVCPEGWHLPSKNEYKGLLSTACGTDSKGKVMTEKCKPKLEAIGFYAIPAGYRWRDGSFEDLGVSAYFWSSSPCNDILAYRLYVGSDYASVLNYNRDFAYSVRCLKD